MAATQAWTLIAAVAYLTATLIFISFSLVTRRHPLLFLGTLLLVGGYGTLGVLKALDAKGKRKGEEQPDAVAAASDARYYAYALKVAYAFMIAFYGLSFILPIAFHTQFYDAFAFLGYLMLFSGLQTLKAIGFGFVFLYYVLGAIRKVMHFSGAEDPIRGALLALVRVALAGYYGKVLVGLA
jgi:hypothetical protein